MKELNRFFESVYKESLLKLTEIEASTMSSLIRKHMATEKDALAYAKELGEKVAKNYDRTPLHPRTSFVLNAQLEFFSKNVESEDRNTFQHFLLRFQEQHLNYKHFLGVVLCPQQL